jgi:adenine-specific DNA-methyltransferase
MPTLHFKGKTFVQNHHLAVKYHQLLPNKELSLTDKVSLHDNLIIQGDNLIALKSLLPTYSGKVKCVCVDPPYNTGQEGWAYNDNVNTPMIQEWLGKVVDKEDLTRHDKWLCMMMPRLKLLKELMCEDGVILIFCDDNEQHNLKSLMNEIFGEDNFISTFLWKKKSTSTNVEGVQVSALMDYVHIYAKTPQGRMKQRVKLKESRQYPLNDKEGNYRLTIIEKKDAGSYKRDTMKFKILGQKPREGKRWQIGEDTAKKYEEKNRFLIDNGIVKLKIYDFEDKDTFSAQPNLLDDFGSTESASKLVNEDIFNEPELFDNPKPVELIKHLISITTNNDSIVLDSFSGSGTLAHSVLELNSEIPESNRKFILVETEDYANEITAERVRRVIKGVKSSKNEKIKKGLGGTFSYFQLGETIEMESLLKGKNLPSFTEFARYLFYTATGEEFKAPPNLPKGEASHSPVFIGESSNYAVYLLYHPDIEWLKRNALTLEGCQSLPKFKSKQRLVFAPCKYVDDHTLLEFRIDFCQLPYEIYRIQK